MNSGIIAIAATLLLATPALAAEQGYGVVLGGRQLGWVIFDSGAGISKVRSQFDNTPLGVFNGSYTGASRPGSGSGATVYKGNSSSSNKAREVTITRAADGHLTDVLITPQKDRTDLSVATNVPPGVLDPVEGFGRLISGKSCPSPFALYDGRRVVQVTSGASTTSGTVTTCDIAYKVVLGPGHLSPLYLKNITIRMEYDSAKAKTGVTLMRLRSGIFEVDFVRG
ncbi:hypothetical protein [Pseudorhodobacter sp.]|uniref:hypothetical protein n=1 Tax=Pseudorhodobacter sp. TaxID=1934400 RepID=UPI002648A158|nr:hypothetical protein [Pseudorhodobacter sp.]MDN5787736.1 hypothetical protein [Pseudorhodobacter sp.]